LSRLNLYSKRHISEAHVYDLTGTLNLLIKISFEGRNSICWKRGPPLVRGRASFNFPTMILAQILNESRPYEYESLMLTCKQIYSAGSYFMKDHNFCKNFNRQVERYKEHIDKSWVSTQSPVELFERLLDTPPAFQGWLTHYSTGISIDGSLPRVDYELITMQKIREQVPRLRLRLPRVSKMFQNCYKSLALHNGSDLVF
jgi:hypothetical protein